MSCQHQAQARRDPYRIFFSLGLFSTVLGVLFWPLKYWDWAFVDHASQTHVFLQIFGFLFSFVVGFLTTAFPRLTQTAFLTRLEFASLFVCQLLLLFAVLGQYPSLVYILFLINCLLLSRFLWDRFLKRKDKLPLSFIYLPFAMGMGVVGSVLNLLSVSRMAWTNPQWIILGTNMIYYGFILFLFLGISGFLVRSIMGWEPRENFVGLRWRVFMASLIFLSFCFSATRYAQACHVVRAIMVSVELIFQVRLYKMPVSLKLAANTLWVSLWMLISGLWVLVLVDVNLRVDFFHATYLGGAAIGTLAIGTRVVLSHSGYAELLQGKIYKPFAVMVLLLLLALSTRAAAVFMPNDYYQHLNYASLCWGLGCLMWFWFILLKTFRIKKAISKS